MSPGERGLAQILAAVSQRLRPPLDFLPSEKEARVGELVLDAETPPAEHGSTLCCTDAGQGPLGRARGGPWGGKGCGEDSGVKRSDVAYLAWPGPEPSSHLLGLCENHHSGSLAHGLNVTRAML